jgi:hypothetical protein
MLLLSFDDLGDLISGQQVQRVQIRSDGFPLPHGLINPLLFQSLAGVRMRDVTKAECYVAE